MMSQLYLRIPDDLHTKLRVIAALKNKSLNSTLLIAARKFVEDWEKAHGELPKSPEAD
jgi:predicted HicB family RNase H-like nuclease